MSSGRAIRRNSLPPPAEPQQPGGPLSGPSNTTWRRQRLLNIGHDGAPGVDETSGLDVEAAHRTSYGTLPDSAKSQSSRKSKLSARRGFNLPGINIPLGLSLSTPHTPAHSPSHSPLLSRFGTQRRISAYDSHLVKPGPFTATTPDGPGADVTTNGIRVWYSSFTSIDWLHDSIKDTARQTSLRKRKSKRGKLLRELDRSVGWLVVSIVGFLTAIVAFMIIRSEQLLFDLKTGYCSDGWLKAKRFCCPIVDETAMIVPHFLSTQLEEEFCPAWTLWADTFGSTQDDNHWIGQLAVEWAAYAVIALIMALISCLLTINLTASTSFVTRKESGVLSDSFAESQEQLEAKTSETEPKRRVLYYAAGSGIPEVKTILSGFVIHGYLGGRTLFTKAVGLTLSVAAGLSLGKEGPFVHIASCIGNIVSRFFPKYETNEGKRREILSAASAAGVAVAFGAPIGGVLFSLEEVSYFFPAKTMWRTFFCAMVAAVTLKFLDPFGSGKLVLFQVTYDKDWHAYELIPFLFLGIFGGVFGAYFSKLNYRWSKYVRNGTWLKTHPVIEVLLVTLVSAFFGFLNPYTRMGGTELVYNLFAECRAGSSNTHSGLCVLDPSTQAMPVIRSIFVALVVKAALTLVTFGIKLPAGIFIPTLGVGACAGRIVGIFVQWAQHSYPDSSIVAACHGDLDCVIPGLYAMVGAAAALSGVTRTTVSLAVIMFELTDTLTYAVPVMLSVLVAKTVADALEPKGIYDLVIELSQLPYLDAKHDYIWGSHEINDVTDRDAYAIYVEENNTVKSLRDKLLNLINLGNGDSGFPILRTDGEGPRMIGYIGASELEHALSIVADDWEESVSFHSTKAHQHGAMASSVTSLSESASVMNFNAFDFSLYMDKAPLTVSSNSPMELVHQFFTKLGARYVVVVEPEEGFYEGVIDKKAWLAFLGELEDKH
ncbi:chloride channel [Cristinia sonorae]|uniref:Chloride channel protein n=1 Tax=Cristinia sonorae TaxID=1940300 RepID=A0A8K0V0D9_9AGAR|nr:chloride channel [Cristinia sonorae]